MKLKKLTDREWEVSKLISYGYKFSMIAAALGISENTVHVHVRNIKKKIGIGDKVGITNWFNNSRVFIKSSGYKVVFYKNEELFEKNRNNKMVSMPTREYFMIYNGCGIVNKNDISKALILGYQFLTIEKDSTREFIKAVFLASLILAATFIGGIDMRRYRTNRNGRRREDTQWLMI
jgi:DNA-binding CsgD family transcriptional regulator